MEPRAMPNHRVHRRMSKVAAPAIAADDVRSNRVSPNMLPSAVPSPPGRPDTEPTNDDTAMINMDLIKRSNPNPNPSPANTKYNAPHSPDHEMMPIVMASSNGRHCNNV